MTEAIQLAFGDSHYNSLLALGIRKKGEETVRTLGYFPINNLNLNLEIYQGYDYYICSNTLKSKRRRTEDLFSLRNIVIDIDCHSPDIEAYEREELLQEFLFRMKRDCNLPPANIIHYTGRGVQIWYCLEELSSRLIFLYKNATNKILEILNTLKCEYSAFENLLTVDAGASKNPVSYCRLFNTQNTKVGKQTVYEITCETRYTLHDLLELLPEHEIEQEKSHGFPTVFKDNEYIALHHKRTAFIERLIEKRNRPAGDETRDMLLFLHYNAGVQYMSSEMAKAATLKLNKKFKQPLERTQNIFDYIDQKGYLKFCNKTWFSFLSLSEEERTQYVNQTTSNHSRDLQRKHKKEERNRDILALKKAGNTNKEIAARLEVSVNTVTKVIKENYVDDRKKRIHDYKAKGLQVKEILKLMGISKQTYYNILNKD